MAIQVECSCGKKFSAKDELAGRKLKCPECGDAIAVPKQATAPATIRVDCECGKSFQAKAKLAGKKVKCSACQSVILVPSLGKPSVKKENGGIEGLFDEVGMEATQTGMRCPECKKDVTEKTVICINCGYDLGRGKKLRTKSVSKKTAALSEPTFWTKHGKKVTLLVATLIGAAVGAIGHQQLTVHMPATASKITPTLAMLGGGAFGFLCGLVTFINDLTRRKH